MAEAKEIKKVEQEKDKVEQEKDTKPTLYYVTEAFYDTVGKSYYEVGSLYTETSPERTAALLEAKVSAGNKIGRAFLTDKAPEGK